MIGPVETPRVPWTEELTLANALVAAGYTGRGSPKQLVIIRVGQQPIVVDPQQLLKGEDVPLQAGDIIDIKQ
jgi:hypothetical protein